MKIDISHSLPGADFFKVHKYADINISLPGVDFRINKKLLMKSNFLKEEERGTNCRHRGNNIAQGHNEYPEHPADKAY